MVHKNSTASETRGQKILNFTRNICDMLTIVGGRTRTKSILRVICTETNSSNALMLPRKKKKKKKKGGGGGRERGGGGGK